jgi:peptidyl-prolyl cis-trans isomerase A (cyclophilin A)
MTRTGSLAADSVECEASPTMKALPAVPVIVLALACDAPAPEPTPSAKKDPAAPASATAAGPQKQRDQGGALPSKAKGPFPESQHPAMKDASKATEKAPETFQVKFETTAGDFTMECTRKWGEHGVDRIYNLVKIGFFDDVAFFRVAKGFVVQFGIHGNPDVSKVWSDNKLPPDEVKESNSRGMVTFAMAGSPDTRSTQLFINFGDNSRLDKMGFAPLCKVDADGMQVVDKIHSGYGEAPSSQQGAIQAQGNKFLRARYPELDYIKTARLADDAAPAASASAGAAPSASAAPSAKAGPAPASSAKAQPK